MDKADPRAKLESFWALIGEWTIEMTHPMVEDTVVCGRATYEWLEGGRFLSTGSWERTRIMETSSRRTLRGPRESSQRQFSG